MGSSLYLRKRSEVAVTLKRYVSHLDVAYPVLSINSADDYGRLHALRSLSPRTMLDKWKVIRFSADVRECLLSFTPTGGMTLA